MKRSRRLATRVGERLALAHDIHSKAKLGARERQSAASDVVDHEDPRQQRAGGRLGGRHDGRAPSADVVAYQRG